MEKQEEDRFNAVLCVLTLVVALTCWLAIGPVAALVAMRLMLSLPESLQGVAMYIGVHVPYILMFLSLLLSSKFLLKGNLRKLLSGSAGVFRFRFAFQIGAIYLLLMAVISPLASGGVERSGTGLSEYLPFIIPVLILTPLQTISEEVFFRALPARIAYKDRLPESWLESIPLAVISGIIFTIPHLWNAEVTNASSMVIPVLCYFLWGSLAMLLSLATDGFEASTAMHTANNLFIALVINYRGSSMPTQTLLIADSAGSIATLIETILVFSIIYIICLRSGKCLPGFSIGRKS